MTPRLDNLKLFLSKVVYLSASHGYCVANFGNWQSTLATLYQGQG
jgi:hypothetical protein